MLELKSENNGKRTGSIKTKNGEIKTPFFMPDATRGFVKSLDNNDLNSIDMGPMVVNTYHLYLNPGMEIIKKAGGIHKFMNWPHPLLSDSGGYQIFSLIHKNPEMGKIADEGAIFRSPIDGKKHKITPEKSIEIQFDLGVDMMVCLDDVPPHSYSKDKIADAVRRTILWAKRCKDEYEKQIKKRRIKLENRPLIFGVIQGGVHLDLREMCAQELIKTGFDGYGFGARHVDSDGNFLEDMVRQTAELIPEDALRFALGVGTPEDIVKFVNCGWDMFDCVIPTREGRHGRLFIRKKNFHETININNEKFKTDFSCVDGNCDCELCRNHTKAYLRHLFSAGDPLAMRLASIHNLKFYLDWMEGLSDF
jgi:queuine tRNA-ribosyltransferase